MIERDCAKPLIYIHIPKTAGTAMQALARANYPERQIRILGHPKSVGSHSSSFRESWEREIHRLQDGDFGQAEEPQIVFGHMSFGLHRVFPHGAQYISMLRHPVARVVSHYQFVKRSPGHHLHRTVVENGLSLEAYVEGTAAKVLNNGQVRCLYGDGHRQVAFDKCTGEMLDQALRNIDEHFVFVGIQELLNRSATLLCRAVGWQRVNIHRKNVSENGDGAISARAYARILEYNALDLLLYQRIRKRVESTPWMS